MLKYFLCALYGVYGNMVPAIGFTVEIRQADCEQIMIESGWLSSQRPKGMRKRAGWCVYVSE